jgi:DNA-binding transcriptional LysR family regulator
MELRHLEYFAAVAEHGSFSCAAERLRTAQSGLSQRIRTLEAELGVRLFDRGCGGVKLTTAGEALLPEVKSLLAQAKRIGELADEVGRQDKTLRLSHTRSAGGGMPAEIVSQFCRTHPEIDIKINAGFTSLNLRALTERQIDVAFIRPADDIDPAVVVTRHIVDDPLAVILPEGHRLSGAARLTVGEILDEPLVYFPRENGPMFFEQTLQAVYGPTPPAPAQVESDQEFVLAAVAGGAGITLLSWSVARILHPRGVLVRRFAEPEPTVPIMLAWRRDNNKPALQSLLSFLK